MIILAVHSTSPTLAAAVVDGERLIGERILAPGRRHLEDLCPLIRTILQEWGLPLSAVDGFAVAAGPGSFSGIRVGMATVKGLALGLGKPVVGVSSLELLAWQALDPGELGAAVLDAARGEVYAALYRNYGEDIVLVSGPMLIKTEEFALRFAAIEGTPLVFGDAAADRVVGLSPQLASRPVRVASAATCAAVGRRRLLSDGGVGLHALIPLYIRRSDAEENNRTR